MQHLVKETEIQYSRKGKIEKSKRYYFHEHEYGEFCIRWEKPVSTSANTSPVVLTTQKHNDQVDDPPCQPRVILNS